MSEAEIVCSRCKVSPEVIDDADGKIALCLRCGQRDNFEDALRIAGEHLTDGAAHAMQRSIAKATRGNKTVEFEAEPLTKRKFRWHAV
jgi:hypothetical protein